VINLHDCSLVSIDHRKSEWTWQVHVDIHVISEPLHCIVVQTTLWYFMCYVLTNTPSFFGGTWLRGGCGLLAINYFILLSTLHTFAQRTCMAVVFFNRNRSKAWKVAWICKTQREGSPHSVYLSNEVGQPLRIHYMRVSN
jgi:hypothetical protein